jgi:late competence protein required for DNA uptake (superfamily II DNA/RNA helicase)
MAVKQKRIKCARCSERETVMKGERGPASIYCDLCRDGRRPPGAAPIVVPIRAG